jgi:iron complex outermembrane receptor protein
MADSVYFWKGVALLSYLMLMIKIYPFYIFILLFFCSLSGRAQQLAAATAPDTTRVLKDVTVKGYLNEQPVLSVPASVSVITPAQLQLQPENSLVSALNTVPGVRMEERSPGSYRLSIRGSLLRSPFGVRDVKVYFDELPLTDAGGNTYLNAIDFNSVQGLEILKGPDGSLFGANSGGVVLISPVNRYNDSSYLSAGVNTGSYGLVHENVMLQNRAGNNQLDVSQAYQSYNGYRQHSGMYRDYFQLVDKWTYSSKNSLKFLGFYSDLDYQTPGGLTWSQFIANPQSARPAAGKIPGAIQENAGIHSKMTFGGLVNELHLADNLRNVLSVYGSYVDFSNPFITNYGNRYETTYGLRTYFELTGTRTKAMDWKVNLGLEWQQTNADINNYGIRNSNRDTAQTLDKIHTGQHFIFTRYEANIYKKLHIEAALSLNFYGYEFKNRYPNNEQNYTGRPFSTQLMPRMALSYQITNNFIWRASVSRGYSTPTTAEIRPTDHLINTSLQAENGWNYETGFRLRNNDETVFLDASVYDYQLHNAIVERFHADETAYYVNAGGTSQPGFELYFSAWIIRQNTSDVIRGLQINESYSYQPYKFTAYVVGSANYSNNQLTGVPRQVAVSSIQIRLPENVYVFLQHNYTARLPLNDGNTAFAGHYHVVEAKAGWTLKINRATRLNIYAGADNLLNQKYSLGNDLNAIGNRYYNAAPLRNYYIGASVRI